MFKSGSLFIVGVLLLALVVAEEEEEQNYDFIFEKAEPIEGTDKFGEYNYTLSKESEFNFKISGHIRQKVTLDDGYSVHLILSRAELGSEEFEEMLSLNKPVCEYMKTIYRMYMYESVKDISNFPHYDNCPVVAPADYWFKDYLFEGDSYKAFTRDGHYRVEFYLTKDEARVAGIVTQMSVKPIEKQ